MKEYLYKGETFQLDDSQGCYIEITYKDQKGWVVVNISIENYGYAITDRAAEVTASGVQSRYGARNTIMEAVDFLCLILLLNQKKVDEYKPLDRIALCAELHSFMDKL